MNIIRKQIEEAKKRKIMTLLASEDFQSLIALLESRVLDYEAQASNMLTRQTEPGDGIAKDATENAASIRRFMELVKEFQEGKNLQTVVITPEKFK